MNLKLITMFNVMPKADESTKRSFEEVNAESAKYGWIIHPDCCSTIALNWVKKEAKTNYNKTFYAKWEDITSKTRFELLIDQLRHYASTYGTDFTQGNGYVPNQNADVEIPYNSFKVIMPATDQEIYDRCVKMLQSGIALESETLNVIIEYITENDRFEKYGLDIDSVKNKEAIIMLMDKTGKFCKDPFNMIRYFVFKATGKAMLIKDKRTIQTIKENANKVDFTKLTDEQRHALASIFYRFKPLFLAFKQAKNASTSVFKNEAFKKAAAKLKASVSGKESNASVINQIRRLAVTDHKPFHAGFWETVIAEKKDLSVLTSKLAANEITNYKKITLMQAILAKLQNASGKMYVIRNGKMWVKENCKANDQSMTSYLMSVYHELERSLVDSLKAKACTVRYPKNVNLTVPTSEKNFIGNYPFGTSVDMGDSHNVVGIYWRNEWGTRDFDLHMYDLEGHSYGWNSSFTNKNNSIIFSGDITNAEPEATELFYISSNAPDGKISVSQYNGNPKSQFKLFIAKEDMKSKLSSNGYRRTSGAVMCDPNNVLAEFIIPIDNERDKQCALIVDNKVFLMDLTQGGGRVPNHKYSAVYLENLKNKCRTFIDLKPILMKAGFTFVEDEDADVELDLTQLSKDTLIDLFAQKKN